MISIFSAGVFLIGRARRKILTELTIFPPFLRFDEVKLSLDCGSQPIEEKCKFFESYLLPLKPALTDSNIIKYCARISQKRSDFSDRLQLFEYIRNQLLSIVGSSRGYKFDIGYCSEYNSSTNVITSLLQMPEIERCSYIQILYHGNQQRDHNQLPIEVISNWLERPVDGKKYIVQNKKKARFMEVSISDSSLLHFRNIEIQNAQEIVNHLKTVYFIFF